MSSDRKKSQSYFRNLFSFQISLFNVLDIIFNASFCCFLVDIYTIVHIQLVEGVDSFFHQFLLRTFVYIFIFIWSAVCLFGIIRLQSVRLYSSCLWLSFFGIISISFVQRIYCTDADMNQDIYNFTKNLCDGYSDFIINCYCTISNNTTISCQGDYKTFANIRFTLYSFLWIYILFVLPTCYIGNNSFRMMGLIEYPPGTVYLFRNRKDAPMLFIGAIVAIFSHFVLTYNSNFNTADKNDLFVITFLNSPMKTFLSLSLISVTYLAYIALKLFQFYFKSSNQKVFDAENDDEVVHDALADISKPVTLLRLFQQILFPPLRSDPHTKHAQEELKAVCEFYQSQYAKAKPNTIRLQLLHYFKEHYFTLRRPVVVFPIERKLSDLINTANCQLNETSVPLTEDPENQSQPELTTDTGKNPKLFDYLFKLMLVGDQNVGKTSILFRFSDGYFGRESLSTIGIDYKIKTIELNGKTIKLQIWDTAGQERFETITSHYYRNAMGIILVYDVTNMKSFEHTTEWLKKIEDNASDDVEVMLLGNKCDSEKRVVPYLNGCSLAKEHGIPFHETSAMVNCNIDQAIYELANIILVKMLTITMPVGAEAVTNTDKVISRKRWWQIWL